MDKITARFHPFFSELLGEERPSSMLLLISTLVVLTHTLAIMWLLEDRTSDKSMPQPLIMEVSMLALQAPKPNIAPAVVPQPEKKPEVKKTPPKPIVKKRPPPVVKTPEPAPVEQPEAKSSPTPQPVQSQPVAASVNQTPATIPETYTEANFKANYLHNPKPEYPLIAKSRGWQGKVMLRVRVSAEGLSDAVEVEHSSGHEMLDESALETVKQWRFIPARRGETAVASSVIVPIIFTLQD